MYIIAADVGGTKTHLAFTDTEQSQKLLFEARYPSGDFESFAPLLQTFIRESGLLGGHVDVLTLALPGLVNDTSARLTNLPWTIDKQSLKTQFGIDNIYFMNDFQASAFGAGQLQDKDRVVLNPGCSDTGTTGADNADSGDTGLCLTGSGGLKKNTTRVAVGAGTGLGVAWTEGEGNTMFAHDTEGGHIDFAPVGDTQIRLLQFLQRRHDHVSYERILSGAGLVSLYEFCAGKSSATITAEWVNQRADDDVAAGEALFLFVQVYGAYIGNIALLFKPYGGIFITGGIAAKILHRMQSTTFIDAYLNKGRMRELVEQVAVYLVTNERVGVLGAMSVAVKTQRQGR